MLERLLLSITVTFSLYLCAQDCDFNTTPTFSVVQGQAMPDQSVNLWR